MNSLKPHLSFNFKTLELLASVSSSEFGSLWLTCSNVASSLMYLSPCLMSAPLFCSCSSSHIPVGRVVEGSEHSLYPSSLGLLVGTAPLPGLSYSLWHSDAENTYTLAPLWTQSMHIDPESVRSWGNAACTYVYVYNLNTHFI